MTVRRLARLAALFAPLAGLGGMVESAPATTGFVPIAAAATVPATLPAEAEPTWPETIGSRLAALEARPHPSAGPAQGHRLAAALASIAASAGSRTRVGISVRDLRNGQTVFDHHGDEPLNPASNQKLLTATAAVELLGADFRFETTFARDDDALYVRGGGDPSLQLEDIESIAATIAAQLDGVERIVIDETFFSGRRFGPGYDADGPGHSYMAPSGALSLQFNTVIVKARPGRAGEPLDVSTFPKCEHVVIDSTANTVGGRGLSIDTRRRGDSTVVVVRGGLRSGRSGVAIRRRIHDPGAFTASTLAAAIARRNGGEALPVQTGTLPASANTLHVHKSAPLREVLRSALKWSNNFTIEQVLRTLGRLASGQPGDWTNGTEVLLRFWDALGEDPTAIAFENASGLSRTGRVAPRALVDLMALWRDGEAAQVVDALPLAGREGTLRGRLSRTHGRVRAKTGTLRGASALTGVVMDRRGKPTLGFSVLVNGPVSGAKARRLQDRIVYALLR